MQQTVQHHHAKVQQDAVTDIAEQRRLAFPRRHVHIEQHKSTYQIDRPSPCITIQHDRRKKHRHQNTIRSAYALNLSPHQNPYRANHYQSRKNPRPDGEFHCKDLHLLRIRKRRHRAVIITLCKESRRNQIHQINNIKNVLSLISHNDRQRKENQLLPVCYGMMDLIQTVHIITACPECACNKDRLQAVSHICFQNVKYRSVRSTACTVMVDRIEQQCCCHQNTPLVKKNRHGIGRKQPAGPHRHTGSGRRNHNERITHCFDRLFHRNQYILLRPPVIIFPRQVSNGSRKQHKQGSTHQCLALAKRHLVLIRGNHTALRVFHIAVVQCTVVNIICLRRILIRNPERFFDPL